MLKHNLLLDTVCYQSKPTDKEIGIINNRIIKHPVEITIEELANAVIKGQTFIPAYIKDRRRSDNWKHQSVFALDFDCGISFEKVKLRLEEYGLDCSFAYSTFSNTLEKPKFRVVWQLNQVILNVEYRETIQKALMYLFKEESDQSCKDASRIFFGGRNIIYSNYNYHLDIDILLESAEFHAVSKSSNKNMSRNLETVRKKNET
jgi:hypothetical protein